MSGGAEADGGKATRAGHHDDDEPDGGVQADDAREGVSDRRKVPARRQAQHAAAVGEGGRREGDTRAGGAGEERCRKDGRVGTDEDCARRTSGGNHQTQGDAGTVCRRTQGSFREGTPSISLSTVGDRAFPFAAARTVCQLK